MKGRYVKQLWPLYINSLSPKMLVPLYSSGKLSAPQKPVKILPSTLSMTRGSARRYVNRAISQTISLVMDVCLGSHNVGLKVYDRRTGSSKRYCHNTYISYTHEERVAYCLFVNRGLIRPCLDKLDREAVELKRTP